MNKFKSIFLSSAPYLIGIFFVLERCRLHVLIPISSMLITLPIVLIGIAISQFVIQLFIKDKYKISLILSFIWSFLLFSIHFRDYLFELKIDTFWLSNYAMLALLSLLIFLMTKTKRNLENIALYISTLCIIYISIEIYRIFIPPLYNITSKQHQTALLSANEKNTNQPNILFLVFDCLSSLEQLEKQHHYKVKPMKKWLHDEQFTYFQNTLSFEPVTYMSLITNLNISNETHIKDLKYEFAQKHINHNFVVEYLKQRQYKIYNFSIFEMNNQQAYYQTFFNQTLKDDIRDVIGCTVPFYYLNSYLLKFPKLEIDHKTLYNNQLKCISSLNNLNSKTPFFVYTHLLTTHQPYVFDTLGNFSDQNNSFKNELVYTEKLMKGIVQNFKSKYPNSIIIIQGDHGSGVLHNEVDNYSAFNAIYFPSNIKIKSPAPQQFHLWQTFAYVFNNTFGTEFRY